MLGLIVPLDTKCGNVDIDEPLVARRCLGHHRPPLVLLARSRAHGDSRRPAYYYTGLGLSSDIQLFMI